MEGTIEIRDIISSIVKPNISLNRGSNDRFVLILNPLVRLSNVIEDTPVRILLIQYFLLHIISS